MFWSSVLTVSTFQITLKLDLSIVIMSIPVSQHTVEQANKEFNSFMDKMQPNMSNWYQGNLGQLAPQHIILNLLNGLYCLLI